MKKFNALLHSVNVMCVKYQYISCSVKGQLSQSDWTLCVEKSFLGRRNKSEQTDIFVFESSFR